MITALYKYPVKGLTGQKLDTLKLVAGEGIVGDREIAIARTTNAFDPLAPRAIPKTQFLMLARDEGLARLSSEFDDELQQLTIREGHQIRLKASVATPAGQNEIAGFFSAYLNKDGLEPRVVRAPAHKFTDISVISPEKMRAISLINLASVRALAEAIGKPVDIRRFRANVYFDTGTPWEEFDWLKRPLAIGPARAKCVMLTKRCPATEVNPDTGERDIALPVELRNHFGHGDMGIYAEVETSGAVRIDDPVHVI